MSDTRWRAVQFYALVGSELEGAPGAIPIAPPDSQAYTLQPDAEGWALTILSPLGSKPPSAVVASLPTLREALEYAEADSAKRGIPLVLPASLRRKASR